MNSRERIIATLNHKEPDKVPIDLNGTVCTALTRAAYINLRKFLNLKEDTDLHISNIQMDTIRSMEDILGMYEVDTRPVYMNKPSIPDNIDPKDGSFEDAYGVRWRPALHYYDAIYRPLKEGTLNELKEAKWENLNNRDNIKGLKERTKWLYENTDYCLVVDFHGKGPFEGGCTLRGYENFLIDLLTDQKYAETLMDRIVETAIKKWDILLSEVGDYVQVVASGDDIGMQSGPYINPETYRKVIKPYQKRFFDFLHSKTEAKVFLHSCGSVYDFIPDLIEIGVDIISPVQRREEIKRTIDIMAPGGGFVFFPSHNIQADVSPDRIDCLFKSVIKYRNYKKK